MTFFRLSIPIALILATAIVSAEDSAKESSKSEKAPDEVKLVVFKEDYEYNIIVKSDGTHKEFFTGDKESQMNLSKEDTKEIFKLVDALVASKPEEVHYFLKGKGENYVLQIKRNGVERTFLISSLPSKKKVSDEMMAVCSRLAGLTKW